MDVNDSVEIKASDREIVIMREFDAPRELLWEAWTNPKLVAQWWGPDGFTTEIETMDVRVGGVWRLTMIGPDGKRYPNASVFQEVVKPERLVFRHGGGKKGESANFDACWTFEDLGGRTRVTIRMICATKEERDLIVKTYGAIEGGKQCLCNFAKFVAKLQAEGSR
ncbi:MAG: SRPBCC family protein [Chrysiogenetes bacterium]|nr:SRPBCC family protein [Chrysiogenetes bacterium]